VLRILPLAVATLVVAALIDDASAQLLGNSPMSSVVAKTNETRQMLVTIGKAAVGVIAAVLFLMALGGRVAWHWVIMVVVAGAGLTGLDSIVAWINS
jgi:fatty acid desaturase